MLTNMENEIKKKNKFKLCGGLCSLLINVFQKKNKFTFLQLLTRRNFDKKVNGVCEYWKNQSLTYLSKQLQLKAVTPLKNLDRSQEADMAKIIGFLVWFSGTPHFQMFAFYSFT